MITILVNLETTQLSENLVQQLSNVKPQSLAILLLWMLSSIGISSLLAAFEELCFGKEYLKEKKKSLLPLKTTAAKCFLWFWAFKLQ